MARIELGIDAQESMRSAAAQQRGGATEALADMTLEDLGNLGEFVGAIAVVISLVYLAVQIRQNTRALHGSSYAQSAEQLWLANLAIAQNRDLARIMADSNAGKPLSLEDTARLEAVITLFFFGTENLFRQYERGLLDSDTWDNVVLNMPRLSPDFVDRMRAREGPLAKRLRAHLESRHIL